MVLFTKLVENNENYIYICKNIIKWKLLVKSLV